MIGFDYSLLYPSYAPYKPPRGKSAPAPPWDVKAVETPQSQLVKAALGKRELIDVAAQKAKLGAAPENYAELFALYTGLTSLSAVAKRADAKGVSGVEARQLDRRFVAGMKEVGAFVDKLKLDEMKLVYGDVSDRAQSSAAIRRDTPEYRTGPLHKGAPETGVAAWAGEVKFQLTVSAPPIIINGVDDLGRPTTTSVPSSKAPTTLSFDLTDVGPPETRTVAAVVDYMNGKLESAGLFTRLERTRVVSPPRSIQVGERTVTLPPEPDSWSMRIKGVLGEALSFSAPESADAVYVAQVAGAAVEDQPGSQARQLLKFQSDVATGAPPPALADGANWVEGRTFSKGMDPDVAAVRASATGPDGAVYMLAELTGDVAGQTIKGARDVALLKYDSAGHLLWSRTLGAAESARGGAIAVSADGKVAIGGSATGRLQDAGAVSPLSATEADSFVTVFDGEGSELWTRRGGAFGADEVKALTFGADGSVYAAGQARGVMSGAAEAYGEEDGWIRGWDAAGKESFTRQFGTAGTDVAKALAVEGSALVVAGTESGRAVLRRFDLSAPGGPVETGVRDLGALEGGTVSGVALENGRVIVAGTSRNGALAGAQNNAHSGGRDAFVAALDGSLNAGAGDRVSYWGGAGDDAVSAVSIRSGQVWVTGSTDGEIAGTTKLGGKDAFVARIDAETGSVGWARRWTAKDGEAAPSAIAVGAGGASVLDRLGLPSGLIDYSGAQEIAASSSARAGDRFYLRVNGGREIAITLEARDTLKTLTERINRSLGFNARAEVTRGAGPPGAAGVFERLQIKPRNARTTIELVPGEGGRDLLGALGLMEGRLLQAQRDRDGKEIVPEGGKTYGLRLARDLNLQSKVEIKRSIEEIDTAMNNVRMAYRALANALKPPVEAPAATGTAPAWMQRQAANYQAALSRLTGE